MRAMILALFVTACVGCWQARSNEPTTVHIPPMPAQRPPCVENPPPPPEHIVILGPESGCPEMFAGCIDVESGKQLARYLTALQVWAAAAWASCQPEEEP